MKLSKAQYKLGILREYLSCIAHDIVKCIRIDMKNPASQNVWIDGSHSIYDLEKNQDKLDIEVNFSDIKEIHIFGYLPRKLNSNMVGENYIEANTIRSIFIRCIDMWFRSEFGIAIEEPEIINPNDWCIKATSFRKV